MDAHKDGKKRTLLTTTESKPGISTFLSATHMRTKKCDAAGISCMGKEHMGDQQQAKDYAAVVMDNTTTNIAAGCVLYSTYPWLLVIFCLINILDLLLENLACLKEVEECTSDCHFIVVMVRKYAILRDEFLRLMARCTASCSTVRRTSYYLH